MVEVERDDVGLAAVHAWVSPKVITDERPILFAIAPNPGDLLPDVGLAVADVVHTPIPRMTDATARLTSSLGFVMKGEVADRLHKSAVIATLCLDE